MAVALKYQPDKSDAPIVVAKGYDATAQKIKAIAAEHNIPMVENIELARARAKEVEVGRAIKPKWFWRSWRRCTGLGRGVRRVHGARWSSWA